MLQPRVIWKNHVIARAVAKKSHNAWVRAPENADNASFSALTIGLTATSLEFGDDVVAMHGVVDGHTWNKNIAIEPGDGLIGDYETIAVVMEHQPPRHCVR